MSIGAIDIVVGVNTPEVRALRPSWTRAFFADRLGVIDDVVSGVTVDDYLRMMDEAEIERSFLVAVKAGVAYDPAGFRIDPQIVAAIVAAHPDRFAGLIGLDPTEGMTGVRELEWAISELGFIGAHGYPHWFGLAPDDRRWYPFYAKCIELDVPIQLQVGQCLLYSPDRPLRSVGRPITLDTVACDLPELKIVGIHIGYPWTDEMISVASKHPNVYVGSDAYAPKYWPPEFVRFLDSYGAEKVLFGTDFPVIDPRRARREIAELPIREESLALLLRGNAARLYRL